MSFARALTILGLAFVWSTASSGAATPHSEPAPSKLILAEEFVDAFYSFDRARLDAALSSASDASRREILFYQGWAQAAHYKVLRRQPCAPEGADQVQCAITVEDDLMKALRIPFNVTDTFHLSFSTAGIASIMTSSDDPPEWEQGRAWVRQHRAELIRLPCEGYFDGGPTPEACARAMVQGLKDFAASSDYSRSR